MHEERIPKRTLNLYAKLDACGISREIVHKCVLPDWWDDQATQTQAGFIELVARISNELSISFESLLNHDTNPEPKAPYMINNDTEYRHEVSQLVAAANRLEQYRDQLIEGDYSDEEVKRVTDPIASFYQPRCEEVQRYENRELSPDEKANLESDLDEICESLGLERKRS